MLKHVHVDKLKRVAIYAGFMMHVATYVAQYRQTDFNDGFIKPRSPCMYRHMFQRV